MEKTVEVQAKTKKSFWNFNITYVTAWMLLNNASGLALIYVSWKVGASTRLAEGVELDPSSLKIPFIMFLVYNVLSMLYMLPAYIAEKRDRRNYGKIFCWNLFTGWTIVAWVVCLIFSLNDAGTATEDKIIRAKALRDAMS
jgi:hypothetical protein